MAVSNNKKDVRLLTKRITRKQNKNNNQIKLRLKFVKYKRYLGTRCGFFYKLYKFTCRSLNQTRSLHEKPGFPSPGIS